MYGELQCLIKSFTRFKTFPNVQNSYQKFYKNSFYVAWLIERNRASIELGRSFRSIFLINSIDWAKASTDQETFLTASIDRSKVSIDWTSWNLNFHKENSRSWNSILFILQMNTLQSYIIITTYHCIYLYIYNILWVGGGGGCFFFCVVHGGFVVVLGERERERERESKDIIIKKVIWSGEKIKIRMLDVL